MPPKLKRLELTNMRFTSIYFEDLSEAAFDKLFKFLYENKCTAEFAEPEEDFKLGQITITDGIEKIELINGITLISDMGDSIELKIDDFYRVMFE